MSIFAKVNDSVGSVLESVVENCNTIETLEEGVFNYKPSMIPVAARETGEGTKYIVEFDMLQKLAGYENSSITEAFEAVCMENCIDAEDVYVFVSEGTCNLISESYVNDMSTGTIMSINYDMKQLTESGVNMLRAYDDTAIQEGFKFKLFGFEKVAMKHPKLKEMDADLEAMNQYRTANSGAIYEKKSSVLKTILGIIRGYYALDSNIDLFIPVFGWIYTAIDRIIVGAIDKNDLKNTKNEVEKVIAELEKVKNDTEDEKLKERIESDITKLREKLNNADKEEK